MSLPALDSLKTAVDSLSLYLMATPNTNDKDVPSPNIQKRDRRTSPNDLLSGLDELNKYEPAAVKAFNYAQDVANRLNDCSTGPENEYIRPLARGNQRQYEVLFRCNGRSFTVIDTFAKQGTEVDTRLNTPIDEIVQNVIQRQLCDFCRGDLNPDKTMGRIMSRIGYQLEDLASGLVIPSQTTRQFRVQKTKYTEYLAVEDMRNIAERYGDLYPRYFVHLCWLLQNFNIAQYIYWCSVIYDRIRSALYQAIPTIVDHVKVNANQSVFKNRFIITMDEPDVWRIGDMYLLKSFYLPFQFSSDRTFDITEWFRTEAAVQDYNNIQYDLVRNRIVGVEGIVVLPKGEELPIELKPKNEQQNPVGNEPIENAGGNSNGVPSLVFHSSSEEDDTDVDEINNNDHTSHGADKDPDLVVILDDNNGNPEIAAPQPISSDLSSPTVLSSFTA
ncbi:hypothetical protein FRC04_006581 [Tulasnella sp. 424]|nr:hypothetical protein FRC04_006581 [Tulasnella sp. 424]KAG8960963.1 hypothetical protein FRC05_006427 [Tulasnella sp. 425]